MQKLNSYIKLFDIYPETFHFNVNGRGLKKTKLGGIISILTIITILFYSTFSYVSFFCCRKPSVINEAEYLPLNKPSKVLNKNLQIVIGLLSMQDQKLIKLNTSKITQKIVDLSPRINSNSTLVSINKIGEFVNCNQINTSEELFKEFTSKYNHFNSSYFICSNLNINPDFLIGGDILGGKDTFVTLTFTLDLCSFEPNCIFPLKMKNSIYSIGMLFYDNFFNVSDNSGYTRFINNYFLNINYGQNG